MKLSVLREWLEEYDENAEVVIASPDASYQKGNIEVSEIKDIRLVALDDLVDEVPSKTRDIEDEESHSQITVVLFQKVR